MKFAVNYSPQTFTLLKKGKIQFDLFKLPAWPKLITKIRGKYPCYVHLPLKVGRGKGVIDNETKEPVKWKKIEKMLQKTDTPLVNLHVELANKHHPDIPQDAVTPEHYERVVTQIIQDVRLAVQQFGGEKVIIENEHDGKGSQLKLNILPQLYHDVIGETGCGFLLDLSHARIAARALGQDEKAYVNALPVQHLRELHLTGIQWFGEDHIQKVRAANLDEKWIEKISHNWMDHLPMTTEDWPMVQWAVGNIQSGAWHQPWVAALEYGGLGGFFGTFTDELVLLEQIPRLNDILHYGTSNTPADSPFTQTG
ncbi:MAG: hypothetical protein Fur0022_47840 [Anaerolineales bacterium]